MSRSGLLLTFIGLITTGCASQDPAPSEILYPNLDEPGAEMAVMSCNYIDLEIRKIDSIRWSMREDGMEARTRSANFGRAIGTTAAVILLSPLGAVPTRDTYVDRVASADDRLVGLLALKRQRSCAATPTAYPDTTDLQVLEKLEELELHNENGELSASDLVNERTALLDGLFDPGASLQRR